MSYTSILTKSETVGLLIDPLDVLFFRDGRPFESATKGRGDLPQPQTLSGMVLARLRDSAGVSYREVHNLRRNPQGEKAWVASVAVRGPWIVKVDGDDEIKDVYFPAPAHLVQDKAGEKFGLLMPLKFDDHAQAVGWEEKAFNDNHLSPLVCTNREIEEVKPCSRWLTATGLGKVLNGKDPNAGEMIEPSELYGFEERTGIGIDPTRGTADDEDGLIYSARFLRLKSSFRLYAEVGIDTKVDGETRGRYFEKLRNAIGNAPLLTRFGGESRRVSVRPLAEPFDRWPTPPPAPDDGGFTTILLSPAIFGSGSRGGERPWLPEDIGALRAAAVPDPLPVSGWTRYNVNGGLVEAARPTRYAVPAGAVYFWQKGRNGAGMAAAQDMYTLSSTPHERAGGFGTAIRGTWKWA